MFCFIPFYST